MGRWEIADIGLLVFVRQKSKIVAHKTALLQSKRLYPDKGVVDDQTAEDLHIGMGRLLPSKNATSLALTHKFEFTRASRYKALKVKDEQWEAIRVYERDNKLDVFYLTYNPWCLDVTYAFPSSAAGAVLGQSGNAGCRVLSSSALRAVLGSKAKGYMPTFGEVEMAANSAMGGVGSWTLQHFVAYEVLKCRQGNLFEGINEQNIYNLFNRRSGPIAAAVAVTIEEF